MAESKDKITKSNTKITYSELLACEKKGGNIVNGKCVGIDKKRKSIPLDKLKIKVQF